MRRFQVREIKIPEKKLAYPFNRVVEELITEKKELYDKRELIRQKKKIYERQIVEQRIILADIVDQLKVLESNIQDVSSYLENGEPLSEETAEKLRKLEIEVDKLETDGFEREKSVLESLDKIQEIEELGNDYDSNDEAKKSLKKVSKEM